MSKTTHLSRLTSFAARFALLLALAISPQLFGQAVLIDFNTPGQLTNNFGMHGKTLTQAAVWWETNSSGIGNSGSLEGVTGTNNNPTVVYLGDSFSFPQVDGARLNFSIMYKGKVSGGNGNQMQFGFLDYGTNFLRNTPVIATNGYLEGNSPANWTDLRVATANNNTNLQVSAGAYIGTNNGTTYVYTNAGSTIVAMANTAASNWFKLSGTFMRTNTTNVAISGSLDAFAQDGVTFLSNVITMGVRPYTNTMGAIGTNLYASFLSIDNFGVDLIDNFAVWMTNGAPVITVNPVSQAVSTYRTATFTAKVDGTPGFTFQWYANGVAITGATNSTYTIPALNAAGSIPNIYVAVTNGSGGTDSSLNPATLTVTADSTGPSVVSVGSVDSTIGVAFSEAVDPTAAAVLGNYTVTPSGTVTSATLLPDGKTVKLNLTAPISGNFTITVSGVTDLAGNALAVNSASGTVIPLTPSDIAAPLISGTTFSSNTGDIDQTAGGVDINNQGDQGQMALMPITGDFDVKVRVQSIIRPRNMSIYGSREEMASAGLMARENLTPGSKMMRAFVTPPDIGMPSGLNTIGNYMRTTQNGAAATIATAVAQQSNGGYYPNMWLRLRRVNNTFTTYWSTNGTLWTQYGQNTTVMAPAMQVGLATTAHTDEYGVAAAAQYRSYGDYSISGAIFAFTNTPTLVQSANASIQWPNTNATVSFTVAVTNNASASFPSNEIQFVWQRADGLGGFTNVPNASAAPSSTPTTNTAVGSYTSASLGLADSGTQYRVIARGPNGLSVTSSVCTAYVTYADSTTPSVTGSSLLMGSNVLSLILNEPLDLTTVSNTANYVITNSLGQTITVTGVILEQTLGTSNNVTRVILFTSTVLTNSTQYFVRMSNLRGTNGMAMTNTLTTVQTPGTIKIEIFTNPSTGASFADITNTAKFLSNMADFVYFTNVFNFNYNGSAFADKFNTNVGRISGYFIPPSNGVYRFYMKNDDAGMLWMNTNLVGNTADPAGRVLICAQQAANANYGTVLFTNNSATNCNMSTNITLTAGVPYYIEGLWKEISGGDGFAMTFRGFADITQATSTNPVPAAAEYADGRFFQPIVINPYATNYTLVGANPAPVRVDVFTNIGSGSDIASLTNSSAYLNNAPGYTVYMPGFGLNSDVMGTSFLTSQANYGAKVSAWFVAPSNGFYRFYLHSDDAGQILMNTNGIDPAGKVSIATLSGNRWFYTNESAVNTLAGVTTNGVSLPISLTNGQVYYIEGLLKQGAGADGIGVTWRSFFDLATATNSSVTFATNEIITATYLRAVTNVWCPTRPYSPSLLAEVYTAIPNGTVADLQNNVSFRAAMPNASFPMQYFGWNRDILASQYPGDNYGVRVSAYFVAPSNATYRFFLRSDDAATLFMNTNGIDMGGKVIIASSTASHNSYANNDSTMSTAMNLTNGQRYYMELLLKEGTGNDGVSVMFFSTNQPGTYFTATAGTTVPAAPNANFVIPADFFTPTIGPVTFTGAITQSPGTPVNAIWNDGQVVTFTPTGVAGAMPVGVMWKKNGVPISGNGFNLNYTLSPSDVGVITFTATIYNQQSISVEKTINLVVNSVNVDSAPPYITSAVGSGLQNEVTVTFSENIDPATGTNIANYSIPGVTVTAAYLRAANSVALVTTPQTMGARYTVTAVGVRDTSRNANIIPPAGSSFTFTAWNIARGLVTVDLFTGINSGAVIPALLTEPKFINNTPDSTTFNTAFGYNIAITSSGVDNYGARVYGWFIAPSNGQYRFFVRGDDMTMLLMNTNSVNSTDPAGKVQIAAMDVVCCKNYGDMTGGNVVSVPISLVGGQMYYMEGLLKEGASSDGISVAFRDVNDPSIPPNGEAIPGYYFAYFGNPDSMAYFAFTNSPASASTLINVPVTLTVGAMAISTAGQPIRYQWQQQVGADWRDLLGAVGVAGSNTSLSVAFPTNGVFNFRALASVPGVILTSVVATVTVTNPVITGPTLPALAWASVNTNGTIVTAQFSEAVTSATAQNPANYALTNSAGTAYTIASAVLGADAKTVLLTITPALAPGNITNYTLTAANILCVDDSQTGGGSYTFYAPGGFLRYDVYSSQTGNLPRPFWTGIASNSGAITTNFYYTSAYTVSTNPSGQTIYFMENYHARVYGCIIPPSNGMYRFFVRVDDGAELWLNTNAVNSASPAGKVLVATAPQANLGYEYTGAFSPYIPMNAGQRYYIEALMREGTSGDFVAVAVKEVGDYTIPVFTNSISSEKIPASWFGAPEGLQLVPFSSLTPSFVEAATNAVLGTIVGVPATIQWYSNNVAIAGATNATYALPSPLPLTYHAVNIQVVATNLFSSISNQFTLSVTVDAAPPAIVGVSRCSTWTNLFVNFSELLDPASATNLANYIVVDDLGNVITITRAGLRPDGRSVALSVVPTGMFDPSRTYYVTNTVGDRSATTNLVTSVATFGGLTLTTNLIGLDFYSNVTGGTLSTFSNDVRFLNNTPDLAMALGTFDFHYTNLPFAGPANYGAKVFGWFLPPSNGVYRFYVKNDDNSVFSMNTNGPVPSGKAQLGPILPCCLPYTNNITPVSLTNGTPYYVEVLLGQGAGQEFLQVTWQSFPDMNAALNSGPPMSPGNNQGAWSSVGYYPSAPVAPALHFGLYGDPTMVSNVAFVLQPTPAATNVAPGTRVTFATMATNAPANSYLYHLWQASVDGGTTWTNVDPNGPVMSDYAMVGNGSNYSATFFYTTALRAIAILPGGLSVTSALATVTIATNLNVAGVSSINGTNLVVIYDRPVDLNSALEPSNYLLTMDGTPVDLTGGRSLPDGRTIMFNVLAPSAKTFSLTIGGDDTFGGAVFDLYGIDESFQPRGGYCYGTTVSGKVFSAAYADDIGSAPGTTDPLVRGNFISPGNNAFDVTAGGSDIWNASDAMYYIARQVTGNFDVRTRVAALTNAYRGFSDINAKAGLVARVSTNSNSRMISTVVTPPAISGWPLTGANNWAMNVRDATGGAALTVASSGSAWLFPQYPWVRLVRQGSAFISYRSWDGINWIWIGTRDTGLNGGAYPDTIYLGLATCSHNNNTNPLAAVINARYRDLYFVDAASIITQPSSQDLNVGQTLTLNVVASNPPNSGAITYQWRKGGTNIVGATGSTLTILNVSVSDAGPYTVIVANDGGGDVSVPAIVTVVNSGPTVASENLRAVQGVATNFTFSSLLGNDSDPEGRPLSIVALSGIAPVTFYTDFETGIPAGTTPYGNTHVTNSVGFTNSNALVLTDSNLNQTAGWVISNLVPGRAVSAFTASFKIRVGDPVGLGADGFSFNIGNDLNAGTGVGEEGSGTGLSVCFDNYDNGNLEAPCIDIKWRGAVVGHVPINKLNSPNWLPVTVNLKGDGTLDVYLTNVPVYLNFRTPYLPIANAQFAFYARTGGASSTHWLDEVGITVFSGQPVGGTTTAPTFAFDFNGGLPGSALVFGNSGITLTGGVNNTPYLRLNDSSNAQAGAIVFNELTPGKVVSGFTANFRMRVGDASGQPADGFSFCFGSDVPYTTVGNAEEGGGTGLSICYDAYQAAGGVSNSAFRVKWGGFQIVAVPTPTWNTNIWIPMSITLASNGAVTLNVNGSNVVTSLATGFTPRSGGRFAMYSRTGGERETHWVDDLNITLNTPDSLMLANGSVLYGSPGACGSDTIYYMVSDGQGGTALDSATVELIDVTPPVVVSPATNRTLFADAGCQTSLPDLTLTINSGLVITDNCAVVGFTQDPAAGTLIGFGETLVTITAWDAYSNTVVTTAYVTNLDVTPPSIAVSTQTLAAVAGQCYALKTSLDQPIASDNCTLAGVGNNAPAQLPVGTNFVRWAALDISGNAATVTQTVVVVDTQVPSITCPATVTVTASLGSCFATGVSLGSPATADNCGVASVVNNAPSQFEIGTNFVTWTVTDVHGNVNACVQSVVVRDLEAPSITCPAPITVNTLADVPAANPALVTVTDNCGTPVVTHVSDVYTSGTTGVVVRTYRATDASGNSATCSQNINVLVSRPAPLAYEPFSGYTNGSLVGQAYDVISGFATNGTWSLGSGDASVTTTAGLTFASGGLSLVTAGGRAVTPAAGDNTVIADVDTNTAGAFAAFVDGGLVGGPGATGTLYYSFLAKVNSSDVPDGTDDFGAFQLYRDGTEVLGVGNNWSAWGYSTFGIGGDGDLQRPSDNTAQLLDHATHLFVVKITYNASADDNVTVWMDPNLALPEGSQPNTVYTRSVSGDASFNRVALRTKANNNDGSWDFDEVRFGPAWEDVTPTAVAITSQPQSVVARCTSNVTFSVAAAGTAPLVYQWYQNSAALNDETNATLILAAASGLNAATYQVRICNPFNSVTSTVATLTVDAMPQFGLQPQSQGVLVGNSITFTSSASACDVPGYQWYHNNAVLPSATAATLTIGSAGSCDAGSYAVVATTTSGSVTSSIAVLTVTNAPAVISPATLLGIGTEADCGNLLLVGGASYDWQLSDAAGSAGVDWDLITAGTGLDVQATAGNPFAINISTWSGIAPGSAANFDKNSTGVWTIASAPQGVSNFLVSSFTIDASQVANDLGGGLFAIEEGSTSLGLRFTPNHAPVATDLSATRTPNMSWKIKIVDLLTNTVDPDGDATALASVGVSTNGATVTTDGTYIYYTNSNNVADAFTYTIRDVRSYRLGDTVRTGTAAILLTVSNPGSTNQNIVSISATNGVVGMQFAGIPGYTYDVQRTSVLDGTNTVWATVHTTNAPAGGLFDFIDQVPPVPSGYYRTAQH